MPNWKKVVVSGSSAHLNQVTASGGILSTTGHFSDSTGIYTDKIKRYSDSDTTTKIILNDEILKLHAGHSTVPVLHLTGGANGIISGSSTSTGSFGTVQVNGTHIYGSSDRIGIGTSSPAKTFHVSQSGHGEFARIEGGLAVYSDYSGATGEHGVNIYGKDKNEYQGVRLYHDSDGRFDFTNITNGPGGATQYYFDIGGIDRLAVTTTGIAVEGNISGSSSSTGSFGHLVIAKDAHIGEDVLADGDVVAYNSSDIRLKDNIQVIQGSLDKIDGIRGVEFDWNEKSPGWAKERGHDVGVIAQEVQKVVPEIVVERKNGFLGVDYKRLVPLLIESVKELKQEVEILKKKVN